ncbi:MAG: HAMP domain-containing histidine kinase, partial [Bacteroidia bacterium]
RCDMKKPGRDRRLRRRILAVFLGAVMLPSLIQAYLGLRYVRQEGQRQEQLVLQGLKGSLADAARKIEEDVPQLLLQTFDSLIVETSVSATVSPDKIHRFVSQNSLLEEVFVMDNKGGLLFPRSFSTQKKPAELQSLLSPVAGQRLIHGEEYEARGKYDDAISNYTSGFNECKITRDKLAFLIRIARCRFKAGDLAGATQTYRRVLLEDADRFYGEEVPYQFIASIQLAQILDKNGQQKEAFDVLARLYGKMLAGFQRFEQNQFMYYLTIIHEELEISLHHAGPAAAALLDSLLRVEETFLQEPARNDFLKANIVPSVEFTLNTRSHPGSIQYALIDHATDSSIYIAFRDLGSQTPGISVIGARLSYSHLITSVADSLEGIDLGENLHVVLLDEKNASMPPGETNVTYIAEESLYLLAGTIQGCKLAIVRTPGMSVKEFTSKGVLLYYALIFTIILMIALGVIFIFHDISREQELTRMKSEFISNVTHEIKTPIASIRSLAENVNEGFITSAEKQKEYFRLIARESEKLGQLVENTLDFSRIESGSKRYNMEECSLNEVIEKTVKRFRMLTEGQEIDISVNLDKNLLPVLIDKAAMEQVLLNLLDNALKYSPGKKVIRLAAVTEGEYLKIAVSDQGIGIAMKDRSRIFDKFYRSDSGPAKNVTGSGIGLTLVKEIVESHGGSITVESNRNNGSTFTIRIPANQKLNG